MTKIELAVQFAVGIANDNSHGYSQADRWGPDYDCSSLVIQAWENAGVPVKSKGATYTGNMRGIFIACGFVDVTYEVGLSSGYGLQAGDVLLNYAEHTAMYIGSGKVVHARSSEGNAMSGDQSGNEIRVQNYWNYPWNCVLRYKGNNQETSGANTDTDSIKTDSYILSKGSRGTTVCEIQDALTDLGYDVGSCGTDGKFGNDTLKAVQAFQKDHPPLVVSGGVDQDTYDAIRKALKEQKEQKETVSTEFPVQKPAEQSGSSCELPDLQSGSSGEYVVLLQALLNVHRNLCGSADGKFGPKTSAALNRFKEIHGMVQDAKADVETWKKLLTFRFE